MLPLLQPIQRLLRPLLQLCPSHRRLQPSGLLFRARALRPLAPCSPATQPSERRAARERRTCQPLSPLKLQAPHVPQVPRALRTPVRPAHQYSLRAFCASVFHVLDDAWLSRGGSPMRLKRFWRTSCVLGRFSVGLEFSADAFPYEAPDKPQMPAEGSLSARHGEDGQGASCAALGMKPSAASAASCRA